MNLLLLIIIIIFITILIIICLNSFENNKQKFEDNSIIYDEFLLNKDNLNHITNNSNLENKINIPIYYINLDRSIDRKNNVEYQFKKFKIKNYTRVSGIDGKNIKNNFKDIVQGISFINNYKDGLLNSEIGCILSHIKAIEQAYNGNCEEVLILEDDVSLDLMYFWNKNLSDTIKDAPNDWEIIQLYTNFCTDLTSKNKFSLYKYTDENKCSCSVAYLINKKGMKNILNTVKDKYNNIVLGTYINNKLYPVKGHADIFLYFIAKTYYTNIPLFYPNILNLKSTICSQNDEISHNKNLLIELNKTFDYYLNNNFLIPKIIHQTWKTKYLPDCYDRWSKNIKEMHPGWEYKLWTDDDNRKFIEQNYPYFLETYDNYDKNIKRVDAVRYFLLYHYGGIYIDMDMTTIKKLDNLIKNTNNCVFGYQLKNKNKKGSIANAFMASPPRHNLFKQLILDLKYTKDKEVLKATGPEYLTNHINNYKNNNITIYDMPIIYTTEWDKKDDILDCDKNFELCKTKFPDSYLITFWTGSWLENNLKYKLQKYIPKKLNIENNQLIPKNIFKILILDDDELPLIPEYLFNCIKSWIELNPEYNLILFDKNDCVEFLKKNFKEDVLKAFNMLKPYSYKCDLIRFCLLYIYGGIYSDIRLTLLQPLKTIIKNNIDFISPNDLIINKNKTPLLTSFIGAIPKHPFLKKTIDNVVNNVLNKYYGNTPLDPTGPTVFGLSVNEVINNGNIINEPFIEGLYTYNNYKYEILNFVENENKKFFIKQNNNDIILTKPKENKINTDFKNSNVYWEMWKKKDIYN